MSIRRIPFLDMLRGLAVLGILVMNIQGFARVELAYLSPGVFEPLSLFDKLTHALGYFLVDQKFITLFSLLFGVSSWIVATNALANGQPMVGIHIRRNLSLLLIGLVHAYLIWNGDILVAYGAAGLLITRSLNWELRKQLVVGVVFLAIPMLLYLLEFLTTSAPERAAQYAADASSFNTEIEALRGGWTEVQSWRFDSALRTHLVGLPLWSLWFAAGSMLIGMVLFRLGIARAAYSQTFYLRWTLAWLLPGLALTLAAYIYQSSYGFGLASVAFGRGVLAYLGALMMAMAYLGLAVVFYQRGIWPALNRTLQAVGRMALTNYLLQSLIATSLFYGYGLGWFEQLTLTQLIPVVLAIWLVNISVSLFWLARFRYGPVEWLWRWLTYGKRPPLRRPLLT